jgi:hypothetical protein
MHHASSLLDIMQKNISQKQMGACLLAEKFSATNSKALNITALPMRSLFGTTHNCMVLLAPTDL